MTDEVVIFDLAGVVCRFVPERRLARLSAASGLPEAAIEEAIWGSGLDERSERGEFSPGEFSEQLVSILEGRIQFEELRAAWAQAFDLDDDVRAVVSALDVPCYAFTNNGPMMSECLENELSGVSELFVRVICSWELKARKPDVDAFVRLSGELQVPTDSMTLVDDSAANCQGAEAAGMRAIPFTTVPSLHERLGTLGL